MGSSTAHLLPNRDELVGIVQGRGRCCFLQAGGATEEEGYGCRLPTITTVIDYIHHIVSQHLTVLYITAAWVAYPCQPSNEDVLAGRDEKKLSKLFHLHPCPISVWLKVIELPKHVLGSCA